MEQLETTILLIDDHPMLRNGVKQLISSASQFHVIGEAGTGQEGIIQAEQLEPDIILLDINLHDISGLDVILALREKNITSRIIMFTVSDDKQDIITALKNGADGYLLKDMEPEDFLLSLQKVADGKVMMNETISQIIFNHIRNKEDQEDAHDLNLLTPREQEIFDLLTQGLSNKLIGRQLNIMDSTVKVHVKSLLKKLNFKSRMEITVWYLQNKN
ncbi:two-component system response regulator NarL [Zophobihabitans entericus]|uniref:Two-component system response regulator NarL n=1 Tax=Zophobihabitans entericus TaxID=1635327 RepID=A0A6G9I977_9GAMM|nr:two-component system response regulator NarL [Zophobihabitans entericus]QIQ20382.1 two-component system response regulator NarL [Zophobihabitans entericus]